MRFMYGACRQESNEFNERKHGQDDSVTGPQSEKTRTGWPCKRPAKRENTGRMPL